VHVDTREAPDQLARHIEGLPSRPAPMAEHDFSGLRRRDVFGERGGNVASFQADELAMQLVRQRRVRAQPTLLLI
jgi:hypothetical protein